MDDSSAGLKGGVGRGSPTPDEHPADLRQSDGDLQDELAASVREVRPPSPLEGRARDESRKRDAETYARPREAPTGCSRRSTPAPSF